MNPPEFFGQDICGGCEGDGAAPRKVFGPLPPCRFCGGTGDQSSRKPTVVKPLAGTEPLAHLLACLDDAVRLMDEVGMDVDARVIEAHRAQLAAGREWPGTVVRAVTFSDGSTNA